MTPRPTLTLLALFALVFAVIAAPSNARAGSSDTNQPIQIIQKTITVEVMTPDGAWVVTISEIRQVERELWVFAEVSRPEGAIGALMQSAASDQVSGRFPDVPVKIFVSGKNWTWANEEPVEWLASKDEALAKRRLGRRLWRR